MNNTGNKYYLMPFRFIRINDKRELLVNEVGDFLFVNRGLCSDIISKKISKTKQPELYADLLSNYFISETPIHPLIDLLAVKYRTKKGYLDDFTSLHIFSITLRCNHKCEYCQVSSKKKDCSKYDMSYEMLDHSIELMFKSPSNNLTMEFQGGEPLFVFKKVKYAIEKAFKKSLKLDKKITFVICTNLSLVTKEILKFCKKYNVLISTSLDGPEHIHNENRKLPGQNSYQKAIYGIYLAKEILGDDRVSALMTTTNYSLRYPKEIIDEYRENGFKNIFLRPINPYGYALINNKNKYEPEEFLNFYKSALQYIINLNLKGEYFSEDYARIILKKILTPFNIGFVDLQSPSGIITNVVVYNRDGLVYVSDEARMLGEMGDYYFTLGKIDKKNYNSIFYGKKSFELSQFMINESLAGCSDCAFQTYCGADPVQNYATQKDPYGNRSYSSFCKKNKEIFRHLFELIDSQDNVYKVFKSWVID